MNIHNYYLVKSFLSESSSDNYLLHLDRENIEGCKLTKIPYIETINTKTLGTLYGIKYCIHSSGNNPRIIRLTSKDKSFNSIYSLDIYNKKMQPIIGFQVENPPKEKILKVISKVSEIKNIYKNQNVSEAGLVPAYKSYPFANKQNIKKIVKSAIESFPKKDRYSGVKLSKFSRKEKIRDEIKDRIKERILMKTAPFVPMIPIVITLSFLFYFYFKKIINWKIEQEAMGSIENDINNGLFNKQKKDDPAFAAYSNTISYIEALSNNKNMVSLIICGPPGTSKTYIVRRTLYFEGLKPGSDYRIEKGGTATMSDVYQLLFDCRDKILILDDFDTPLKNPDMINFLKSITDTYERRIISMPREKTIASSSEQNQMQDAPQKFEFKGKILIITNLEKAHIDKALLSRCPTLEVKFDSKKILELINKMITYVAPTVPIEIKKEVYSYLVTLYRKNSKITIDFRTFKAGIDARLGNPRDWKNMILIAVS